MKTTVSHRTLSVHQEHELLLKLETAGLTPEIAQKIIESRDNYLATKMVKAVSYSTHPTNACSNCGSCLIFYDKDGEYCLQCSPRVKEVLIGSPNDYTFVSFSELQQLWEEKNKNILNKSK